MTKSKKKSKTKDQIRVKKKKYLIYIRKYKRIYCEIFFLQGAKSNFV
jgi:hypothetical protein